MAKLGPVVGFQPEIMSDYRDQLQELINATREQFFLFLGSMALAHIFGSDEATSGVVTSTIERIVTEFCNEFLKSGFPSESIMAANVNVGKALLDRLRKEMIVYSSHDSERTCG